MTKDTNETATTAELIQQADARKAGERDPMKTYPVSEEYARGWRECEAVYRTPPAKAGERTGGDDTRPSNLQRIEAIAEVMAQQYKGENEQLKSKLGWRSKARHFLYADPLLHWQHRRIQTLEAPPAKQEGEGLRAVLYRDGIRCENQAAAFAEIIAPGLLAAHEQFTITHSPAQAVSEEVQGVVSDNTWVAGSTILQWKEMAKRDDVFSMMVPSDLRALLALLQPAKGQ